VRERKNHKFYTQTPSQLLELYHEHYPNHVSFCNLAARNDTPNDAINRETANNALDDVNRETANNALDDVTNDANDREIYKPHTAVNNTSGDESNIHDTTRHKREKKNPRVK
jgi:hypothetical protein